MKKASEKIMRVRLFLWLPLALFIAACGFQLRGAM